MINMKGKREGGKTLEGKKKECQEANENKRKKKKNFNTRRKK